jgi:hypothetical protein
MTYPQKLLKVTLGCRVSGTDEIAETGFYAGVIDGGFDPIGFLSAGAGIAGSISTAFVTLRANAAFVVPTWSVYSFCKVAPVDTLGHYVDEPQIVTAVSAGSATSGKSLQESVVLSLRSGQSLGFANRGRMYLPHMSGGLSTNGYRYSNPTGMLTAAQTFFNSVNTALGSVSGFSQCRVLIASKKGVGAVKRASQCLVGDLPDTQRRRKNRIAELYVSGSI